VSRTCARKAGGRGGIEDALVARQRERQERAIDPLDSEDRCLRRAVDRHARTDPEHAGVRHRDRRSGELWRRYRVRPDPLGEPPALTRDLRERLDVGVGQRRDDEPAVGGDGDPDVHLLLPLQAPVTV